MVKKNFIIFKNTLISLIFFIFLLSCSYEKTKLNLNSIFEPTWDFSKSSKLQYDQNYVEVSNGKTQLKKVDLDHIGIDFDSGLHAGSCNSTNTLKMRTSAACNQFDLNESDLRNLLPNQINNLKQYWKFDTDFKDSITGSDAIKISNPLLSTNSRIGSGAVQFNGSSDCLNLESIELAQAFTVSMFVNPSDKSIGYDTFIATDWYDPGRQGFFCWFNDISHPTVSGYTCEFETDNAGPTFTPPSSVKPLTELYDKWSHIVIQSTGTEAKVFFDGNEIGSGGAWVSKPQNQTITLGCGLGGSFFKGSIDEVAVFDTALSPSEILQISQIPQQKVSSDTSLSSDWIPKINNIIGYWKMDGNWQDSSGNGNHGTVIGDTNFSNDLKVGLKAGQFDGSGDSIDLGSNLLFDSTKSITITGWFKYNGDFTGTDRYGSILQLKTDQTTGFLVMVSSEFNGFTFGSHLNFSPLRPQLDQTLKIQNTWTHFTIVYNGLDPSNSDNYTLYLNASAIEITPSVYGSSISNINKIGEWDTYGSTSFNGIIDEVSIWQDELSHTEVSRLYNRQKQKYASHYDSEVFELGSATSSWPDLSWSTNLPYGKELIGDFDNDGTPDNENSSAYAQINSLLGNGLISYWNFNEEQKGTAVGGEDFLDLSGKGIHISESNGIDLKSKGKFKNAISFDGSDDYINIPYSPAEHDFVDLTVSYWIFIKSSDQYERILGTWSGAGAEKSWSMGLDFGDIGGVTDNRIFIQSYEDAANRRILSTMEEVPLNQWLHIVGQYSSGQNPKIYINSLEVNTFTSRVNGQPPGDFSGANNITVGAKPIALDRNGHFIIDELAIWNRVLQENEIQEIYRRGANRIKFQVKSCVDSTCECKSLNNSPIGNNTDCDGDTITNALDFDDVHKAEFVGPGGNGTTYYSEHFNRKDSDLTFNCGVNSSDNNSNVCVNDEITFGAGPRPTSPIINFDSLPLVARPDPNPYFQYRVYMEAEENSACGGTTCLPELTSVTLNTGGVDKYYGSLQEVSPISPISYSSLKSISVDANTCVTFQLSPDNINFYYWNTSSWVVAATSSHRSSKTHIENNITNFGNQFGPGLLYLKAFLESNPSQTSACSIQSVDLKFSK